MKGDFTRFDLGLPPPSDEVLGRPYDHVLRQQGRVSLDADANAQRAIGTARRRTDAPAIVGAAPVPWMDPGFAIAVGASGDVPPAPTLTIGPGTLHAGGFLCRNDATLAIDAQPDAPGQALPAGPGRVLVYLDVRARHVTALEAPSLLEPALAGADTTTRVQTLWQVRTVPVDAAATGLDFPPGWAPAAASTGTLVAALDPAVAAAAPPGILPPTALYRGLTNQLYRVEILTGGTIGGTPAPCFQWSRSNGSVAAAVTSVAVASAAGQTITIAGDATPFLAGWIELVRPEDALAATAGPLLLVTGTAGAAGVLTIDASTALPSWAAGGAGLFVRRWDGSGDAAGIALAAAAIPLENGLTVTFGAGEYTAGDDWIIPARTAISAETGTILWPAGAVPVPARGADRCYVPLALVDVAAAPLGFTVVEDCRVGIVARAGAPSPPRVYSTVNASWAPLVHDGEVSLDALVAGLLVAAAAAWPGAAATGGAFRLALDIPLGIRAAGGAITAEAATIPFQLPVDLLPQAANRTLVRPRLAGIELLLELLAAGGAGNAALSTLFDFIPVNSRFYVDPASGGLSGVVPDNPQGTTSDILAVTQRTLPAGVGRVELAFTQGWIGSGTALAGLLFNYHGPDDYWTFVFRRQQGESSTGSVYTAIMFLLEHAGAEVARVMIGDVFPVPVELLLTISPDAASGQLHYAYTLNPGQAGAVAVPLVFVAEGRAALPAALVEDTPLGVVVSGPNVATFTLLAAQQLGGATTIYIPIRAGAGIPVRLVADARATLPDPASPQARPGRVAAGADTQLAFNVTVPLRPAIFRSERYGEVLSGFGTDLLGSTTARSR